jgi:hypothetical protein
MSDTTLERADLTPPERAGGDVGGTERRPSSGEPPIVGGGGRAFLRRWAWWFVGGADVLAAAIALRWANTRPGYDPYGWLIWGYQTLHGSLDLGGAPSWKPFTYIFDVPFALFGHWALYIWMLTSVSISFAGAIFGARIAYRLTGAGSERRWAAWVAALFAGASVLGIQDYFHYLMSVQSDPMLVTVSLAAIDCFLCKRYAWAWWLGVLVGLGRPEVWPFLVIYGVWILRRKTDMRWMVVAAALITAFLWFGVPEITNGRPNIAGQLALKSPRELHSNKITGTIGRFTALDYLPLELAGLLVLGLALLRRNWVVVTLAAMAAGWVVIEVAFVLHGFPGVPRYLFEPAGLTAVLAGVLVGWLLLDARRWHPRLPSWAGIPLVVLLVAVMVPRAISQARAEHKDIYHERGRTEQINKLGSFLAALGGPQAILACGQPVMNVEYVSVLGWYMHRNTGKIGYRPEFELTRKHNPIVMFTPLPNGWLLKPYRTAPSKVSACAHLNAEFVPTARHPHGVLIEK